MRTLLVGFISFIFKRTSENAVCLIIQLSSYLSIEDCEESAEYLEACKDLKIEVEANRIKHERDI